MSVTKTMRECYQVRDGKPGGDWANITLACWENPPQPGSSRTQMYYGGEITIRSSWGVWGHSWMACASPFKRFLIGAGFDYLFGKFMGFDLDRFDGDATLKEIKRRIAEERRRDGMDRREAREVWDAVQAESGRFTGDGATPDALGFAMFGVADALTSNHPMHDYFLDPAGWPRITRYDHGAAGFWRTLWPAFCEALKVELREAEEEAKASRPESGLAVA